MRCSYHGSQGPRNRAPTIDRRIKGGRPTAHSRWWPKRRSAVSETGWQMRFTYRGSQGSPKSRPWHRQQNQRRVVDGPLLVGGRNGDRAFRKRALDALYVPGITWAPEIARESSSTQSKEGGRWRTLSGWPKWANYDQLRPLVINCGQLCSIVVV